MTDHKVIESSRGAGHLSLRYLSPFNMPKWQGITMVVKSYFDGSGKVHDPSCVNVTLGGYVASKDQWDKFDLAWEAALSKHHCPQSDRGNPYFHSKEVFHRHDGYENWDSAMVRNLMTDLYNVLAQQGRMNLIGFSCIVQKSAYEAVKADIPSLRKIEAICLDTCIGNSFRHPQLAEDGMEIYFDRQEEFEPILRASWNEEVNGERTWWAKDVLSIGPVNNMRYVYALQGADLLAWTANRYHTHGHNDQFGGQFFILAMANAQCFAYYDEAELRDTFNADGSMRQGPGRDVHKIHAPGSVL